MNRKILTLVAPLVLGACKREHKDYEFIEDRSFVEKIVVHPDTQLEDGVYTLEREHFGKIYTATFQDGDGNGAFTDPHSFFRVFDHNFESLRVCETNLNGLNGRCEYHPNLGMTLFRFIPTWGFEE